MILVIFLLLVQSAQSKFNDFPVYNQDSQSDAIEMRNIQDLTNKSVGYLPIAEILKRVNLTHISNGSRFYHDHYLKATTIKLPIPRIQQNTIKILLTGSDEEVLQVPYNIIMANLKLIDTVMLSQSKKAVIWDLITNNVPVESMNPSFLNEINGLWHDIPENELVKFNVQHWDVLNFFGSSKFLKRRQAAILAYMIKKRYGLVLQKAEYINKLKGLICGFPESDLANITSVVFKNIEQIVFQNIWPCTLEQVKALLNNAKRPDTYGPLEVWTKEVFEKLALVITVIKPYEFRKFNEEVFQGLNITILDLMSNEQLAQFTEEQVANLKENVMMSYNLRINKFRLIQESEENESITIMPMKIFIYIIINVVYMFMCA